ncbi:MAG: GNAT family N-acetyltransferase [Alphaproteobacteria bacterium]|nr:GNAT family N-acetyltransferase [Alphaproteobacteria bacterium]
MTSNLINLYHQAEDYFWRAISWDCLEIADEAKAYITGVQAGNLNPVFVRKQVSSIEPIQKECVQFYGDENLDFVMVVPEELTNREMDDVLKGHGYSRAYGSMAMALDLRGNGYLLEDAAIAIRSMDGDLDEWSRPLSDAFESTQPVTIQYTYSHKMALGQGHALNHFSLFVGHEAVSSITLSIHNGLARIDDLGTSSDFQCRGFATHLMKYVLLKAIELGATKCFLDASVEGLSLYKKLGFKSLFKTNIYEKTT